MPLISEDLIQRAIADPTLDLKCNELHPGISCNEKMLEQFMSTNKSLYKMYLIVHLIPFVIFKRKKFKKQY